MEDLSNRSHDRSRKGAAMQDRADPLRARTLVLEAGLTSSREVQQLGLCALRAN